MPHPRAVGSYGPELLEWARPRFGMHPKRTDAHRYWQELVMCVALQHDAQGDLLFRTVQLGTSRQSGKSWGLRELCMWRIEQGDRWGELQTVVHAAAKLSQAEAVWKPAALWAARQPRAPKPGPTRSTHPMLWDAAADRPAAGVLAVGGYEVRRANGSAGLFRPDGSAWIPQAANDQLGVSLSVSLSLVDEAWDVPRWVVDNGLVPTQAEARSPQLWIVSTAGRPKTGETSDLYPVYREAGVVELQDPDSHLIIEWSADPDADPGALDTWRQASPFWSEQRAQLLEREWRKAQKSEDAMTAFRMQWLNIWPSLSEVVRAWLLSDLWDAGHRPGLHPLTGGIAAVEDQPDGAGGFAAVAWAASGRIQVVAQQFDDLGAAFTWADRFEPSQWLVGYSLRTGQPATSRRAEGRSNVHTAAALPEFRRLVHAGALHWDGQTLADNTLAMQVRDNDTRSGLQVIPTPGISSAGVRCAAWACYEAQRLIGEELDDWTF